MVKRYCPKCFALFDRKSTYDKHINKKFDCSVKNNIAPNNETNNENTKVSENLQELAEINKNDEIMQTNIDNNSNEINETIKPVEDIINQNRTENNNDYDNNIIGDNEIEITKTDKIDIIALSCSYCHKSYSSKYTLERHINENCKIKKSKDEEKENIFKLLLEKEHQHKEEVQELKKQNKLLMDRIDKLISMKDTKKTSKTITTNNNQSIITNNVNSNNTQNNIMMVNFGKEDLSIIDEKQFIERIIKKPAISGVKIPDEVLKIIHFNPMYPQHSNIYISDINREKCMVYEDGEWKLSNVNNIPQIMDKVCVFSAEQISALKTKYPNNKPLHDRLNTIEKYNNMIDGDYVGDLRDEGRQVEIARCEEFQTHTYNTLKKTLYNEGKKLKKLKNIYID